MTSTEAFFLEFQGPLLYVCIAIVCLVGIIVLCCLIIVCFTCCQLRERKPLANSDIDYAPVTQTDNFVSLSSNNNNNYGTLT